MSVHVENSNKTSATNLEVWAGNTFGKLPEKRHHNFLEFCRLNHVQDLLKFVQEHDLLEK
jgi:hypothetical protein